MKTFILKGVPINNLLDSEFKILHDANVEVAITDNNNKFGIDNKTDLWPVNTNSIIFMWPEGKWVNGIDYSGKAISNIIKHLFEYRTDIDLEPEWNHISNLLYYMNSYSIMIYNLTTLTFE